MKQFLSVNDVANLPALIAAARMLKQDPFAFNQLGIGKRLGMVFMNPSLRTRLSTEIAAKNLGLDVQVMNLSEAWPMEFEDGAIMDGAKAEHIKEAAGVFGQYFDILALRAFPGLVDRAADDEERVLRAFQKHANKPLLSLESATRHPLQSLADLITIEENKKTRAPKVVLTWAPHVRALPQAVPHSFLEWTVAAGYDVHLTHPPGLDLDSNFTKGVKISNNQDEALANADFIYVKNWSKREPYGEAFVGGKEWALSEERLKIAPQASIMHCLPVRRNVELSDELLDGTRSLVLNQAANRVWAAQSVLKLMLEAI